jgi:hypothetical protein
MSSIMVDSSYFARNADRPTSYLDISQEQSTTTEGESTSIKGMVNIPAASNFSESKKSLNELASQKGDLASVPNIDICGFLGDLPSIDLDIPNIRLGGLPSLNDIMGAISGITLPALQISSELITGVVGKIGDAIEDIGKAIQGNIPTISCGKPKPLPELPAPPSLGQALTPPSTIDQVDAFIAEPVPYGTSPSITIESPDVTVKSLDDEIDAGEF